MIEGRTVLYKGFMIIFRPRKSTVAYRGPDYFVGDIRSYDVSQSIDITEAIDAIDDHGDFTPEQFEELVGSTSAVPVVDTCIGCDNLFPAEELSYEGVEPAVYAPRCRICMIKQVQDMHGAENVILGEEFRN